MFLDFNPSNEFQYWILKSAPVKFYPLILKFLYKKIMGTSLNLEKPITLSEKLQWLKLYDINPLKNLLSDKLESKNYIKKRVPDLKTAAVYQECCSFDKLDFNKLPESFVIKTNHACKTCSYISNKNDISNNKYLELQRFYAKVLSINYEYWGELELQYKNIKPKIYAEEYLKTKNGLHFSEYEVYCLNENPEFIITINDKGNSSPEYTTYDINWNKLNFQLFSGNNFDIAKPFNLDKILCCSRILSKGFKFVRVDFFEVDGDLYFGEMTFTPFSGYLKFQPAKFDILFGNKLNL